jgi:predicted dehydrogenase
MQVQMIRFALIGDGYIATFHRQAIKSVGGDLVRLYDPKYDKAEYRTAGGVKIWKGGLDPKFFVGIDYVVICSPSQFHRKQLKYGLTYSRGHTQFIVEKPYRLPWEDKIDNDRINVVLQLRYLPSLPEKAKRVRITAVRDPQYFESWKGDARLTGGLLHMIFIHYIDLAQQLDADFEGVVLSEGEQRREIWVTEQLKIDIFNADMRDLYSRMYQDIIQGGGVKPSDVEYLHWTMERNSDIYGYGKNGVGKRIVIPRELL